MLGPLTIAHSAFVHANLDWTLGPFKYVIAGPVFHRWHHTAADRGGEKNFAATFPILDVIFGTFYMPAGQLPDNYGIGEDANIRRAFPASWCIRSPSDGRPRDRRPDLVPPVIVKKATTGPAAAKAAVTAGRANLHFIHEFAVKWTGRWTAL